MMSLAEAGSGASPVGACEPSTSDRSYSQDSDGELEMLRKANLKWKLEKELDQTYEENRKESQKDLKERYTLADRTAVWHTASEIVRKYSEEMVDGWNKTIDALLTFAGLFSAVLTAFNVQSYELLQPDDSVQALRAIGSLLVTPPSNSTSTAPGNGLDAFPPPFILSPAVVWINALWFSSLICSLSAALISILVKQWIHTYRLGISGDSQEIAILRQYRLENLEKWRVSTIVATLPILLQISVVLFLVGLLILLWTLNEAVAVVATLLMGLLLAFLTYTTIAPSFAPGCSYLSPQSEFAMSAAAPLRHVASLVKYKIYDELFSFVDTLRLWGYLSYELWDRWTYALFTERPIHVSPNWRASEQRAVARTSPRLRSQLSTQAYLITLDDGYLANIMSRCLVDMEAEEVLRAYREVQRLRHPLDPEPIASSLQYAVYHYSTLEAVVTAADTDSQETDSGEHSKAQDEITAGFYSLADVKSESFQRHPDTLIRILCRILLRSRCEYAQVRRFADLLEDFYRTKRPLRVGTLRYLLITCKYFALHAPPTEHFMANIQFFSIIRISLYCMAITPMECTDPDERQTLRTHGVDTLRVLLVSLRGELGQDMSAWEGADLLAPILAPLRTLLDNDPSMVPPGLIATIGDVMEFVYANRMEHCPPHYEVKIVAARMTVSEMQRSVDFVSGSYPIDRFEAATGAYNAEP